MSTQQEQPGRLRPTNAQIMAWCRGLRRMSDEADEAYGEQPGRREPKIAALLAMAWEAVWDEQQARVVGREDRSCA